MKRTVLGSLFGDTGIFISQPGDNLDAPQKSLLLDSRYEGLEIHAYGRNQYSREVIGNATYYRSLGAVSFPSLGYLPMSYSTIALREDEEIIYPLGKPGNRGGSINAYKFRIGGPGLNQIFTEFEILNNTAYNHDFLWVIYRNPW